jgi:hypothetical protein
MRNPSKGICRRAADVIYSPPVSTKRSRQKMVPNDLAFPRRTATGPITLMTATSIVQRNAHRPIRPQAATHLFAVGQAVRLRGNSGMFAKTAEIYRVTRTLPPSGDSLQYCIRNEGEHHERVTTQDRLELVDMSRPDDGATLIERTFWQGPQGT